MNETKTESLSILHVEDNSRHAELVRDELEVEIPEAEVTIAESVATARETLATRSFSVILLDFRLPDGDGLELLRELRQANRTDPVVFVTTSTSASIAVEAMKIGAEDYIIKEEGYVSILPFVVREVIERVRNRDDRRALEQRLERAERLAALNTLTAGIAHNLNNPLTTVRTFLELLPSRYLTDEEFRTSYYELVLKEVQRIKDLISSMMQAVTIPADSGGTAWQVADLVYEIEGYERPRLGQKRLRLECLIATDLPTLRAGREAIKQSLIILLDNAIGFSPEGGTVRVEARRESGSEGAQVVVEVTDQGPGVPSQDRGKIFDPFYSTRTGGLGMGLFVAYCVARAYGGSIDVNDNNPRGATFSLTLPASA